MLFIAACVDKPNSVDKRLANRPAHLAYLKGLGAKVKVGGAMLDKDGQTPIGSMLIFEGESEADIRATLSNDPYTLAGLFDSVTVTPWRQAVGQLLA
jgi:uncharacterized protein YciI